MTARRKTRFVVRRGRMGVPLWLRENLRGVGAKTEYVPVPVLVEFESEWALSHAWAQRARRTVGDRGYTQSR